MALENYYVEKTSTSATLTIGFIGTPGYIIMKSTNGKQAIKLNGEAGIISLKNTLDTGVKKPGTVVTPLNDSIVLDGTKALLTLGCAGAGNDNSGAIDGDIVVKNANGKDSIALHGRLSRIIVGGDGSNGDIIVNNANGKDSIVLHGDTAQITLGGDNNNGDIFILNSAGKESIVLNGGSAEIRLGGDGNYGNMILKDSSGNATINLDGATGNLTLGGVNNDGDIIMKNNNDIETLRIHGSTGDIEFLNADFAEEFDICENCIDAAKPGSVMILDETGKLIPCEKEYDSKVVGIIAGAGTYKPGIVMDKTGKKNRLAVAMVGKVFCLVDADISPIKIGDMLTTSKNTGHAMKVLDKSEAFGTVIGKALSGLPEGKGLIPVLVNLQ